MSNILSPSMRVGQQLSECAMLEGAHSTVVLLAVKCLKRPRTELQRTRMTARLLTLEKLRHPHIVRYYINSLDSNEVAITVIMEAWGVSVSSLIANKEHRGKEHVAMFAAQVLRAIIGLHSVGIAHGDIKPGNILLGRDVYKLCDVDEEATGTAYYMSQARARRHPCPSHEDTFSDTFALGMCVLEVLTGRQPYCELDSQCVVFARVCAGQPPRSWSAQSRDAYDQCSDCLISALIASDEIADPQVARASPSELLALVQLLYSNNDL